MSVAPESLRRLALACFGVGAVSAGGWLAAVALGAREPFFHCWLLACVFWAGPGVGGLVFLMIHHLTGGRWGRVVRPPTEAAALALPALLLLFLPLAFGLESLFPWARIPAGEGGPVLEHRRAYLNAPFFLGRNAAYFAVWIALGLALAWRGRAALAPERPRVAGVGLVLLVLSVNLAAYDWLVALHEEWYSTIVGLYLLVGLGLTAIAQVALLSAVARPVRAEAGADEPQVLQDVGNLLLTCVILYAYVAFSQWLITWSGDLPAEVSFYLPRVSGAWEQVAQGLMVAHFALPFLVLLSRPVKRHPAALGAVAAFLLAAHLVAIAWMILPVAGGEPLELLSGVVCGVLGVGGLWLAVAVEVWRRREVARLGAQTAPRLGPA